MKSILILDFRFKILDSRPRRGLGNPKSQIQNLKFKLRSSRASSFLPFLCCGRRVLLRAGVAGCLAQSPDAVCPLEGRPEAARQAPTPPFLATAPLRVS